MIKNNILKNLPVSVPEEIFENISEKAKGCGINC